MALAVAVVAAYAPARDGAYVWDDHALVERDAGLRTAPLASLFTRPLFARDPMSDARPAYYRPLVAVSLRADEALLGAGPRGHHLVNVGLHAIAALLALACATRLGAPSSAAWLAACAWALAPRSTEAVAWISGRTDVLASVFVLGAVAAWPWPRGDHAEAPARTPLASVALLLAGLLSKEVAAAGVVALAGATWLSGRRDRRRLVAWLALPLAVYLPLRVLVLRDAPSAGATLGPGARAVTALEAVGRYAAMALDPWHPQTSIGLVGEPAWALVSAGAALVAAAGAAMAFALRARARVRDRVRGEHAVVFALLALAAIAPVVHLVPLGLASAVAADRLLYLPLAGVALALAVASRSLPARARRPCAAAALALSVTFAPATHARARDYQDELAFWVRAAEDAHPHNTAPAASLAGYVRELGDATLACRLLASTERVLARTGRAGTQRHGRAVENLASCLALTGDHDGARGWYLALVERGRGSGRVFMGLGYAELHRFAFDEAEAALRRALSLDAGLEAASRALAELPDLRAGAARLASEEARAADRVGWARLLARSGRVAEASARWAEIAADPSSPAVLVSEALDVHLAARDRERARVASAVLAARGGVDRERADALASLERSRARVDALRGRLEAIASR